MRAHILSAFEAAELETDAERRRAWLTFVVVGGGPTGVEMAGQIGELARDTCAASSARSTPAEARGAAGRDGRSGADQLPAQASDRAARALEHLGVTPLLGHTVVEIDDQSVTIEDPDQRRERIPTRTVIWAAGVTASVDGATAWRGDGSRRRPGGARLGRRPTSRCPASRGIRPRRHGPGARRGRRAAAAAGRRAGRHAAGPLRGQGGQGAPARPRSSQPFHYRDKGNVATIGRARAVADIKGLRVSGFPAWVLWLGDPHLVPDRVREPDPGADPLVIQLLQPRARRPGDRGVRPGAGRVAGMGADRKELARELYAAFSAGDRQFFEEHLAEDLTFSSRARPGARSQRVLRAMLAGSRAGAGHRHRPADRGGRRGHSDL